MSVNTIVWVTIIAIGLLLVFLHLSKPLTNEETIALATMRRNKSIRAYYAFDKREYVADADFKKKMRPSGQMYAINDSLWEFPGIAAALLKGKKHEWIIIGFEKNKRVNKMWAHKGNDNQGVNVLFSPEQLVNLAKQDDCLTVLMFHNHPNSNPQRYDCSIASNQDKTTASMYANVLNTNGINLIEFVCERGQHNEYFLSTPESFMPIKPYLEDIQRNNGISRGKNIELQFEMMRGTKWNSTYNISISNYGNKNFQSVLTQIPAIIFVICLLFYPKALLFIVPTFLLVWLANGKN